MAKSWLYFLPAILLYLLTGCEEQTSRPLQRAANPFLLQGWRLDTIFQGDLFKSYLIEFVNEQTGFAISTNYGDIFKTRDGGASWVRQSSVAQQNNFLSFSGLDFIDEQHGFISVQEYTGCPSLCKPRALLLVTADGGNSWQLAETNLTHALYQLHYSSLTEAVGVALEGLFQTSDGGKTWQLNPTINTCNYVNKLQFIDASVGFVWGKDKMLYQTLDGGKSWQATLTNLADDPFDFQFVNSTIGYAATFDGFYKTEDGGRQWSKLLEGRSNLVGFTSPQEGLLIQTIRSYPNDFPDEDRQMVYTYDGAASFTESKPVYNLQLNQAEFVSADVGYIAQGSMILKLSRQ